MFRFPFVLITLIFTLLSTNLPALEVNDLYQAKVVVDSQARSQREQAIKLALQRVFLKVGGKPSVLADKVLQQAQKKANRYVSQYRYQRKDGQLSLVVSFNEDKVNQLFEKANLALWGSLRPQVLLWLIDEQGKSRRIIAANPDSINPDSINPDSINPDSINSDATDSDAINLDAIISVSVNEFSIKRGLPIVMPLMDITDRQQVVVSDFWLYSHEKIERASRRYFADTIIVMRVSDSSLLTDEMEGSTLTPTDNVACGLLCEQQDVATTKVLLDWRVYTQGALYTQKYQGVDKLSLINQGLSDITALIYQSYALLDSAENDFVIEVENVTSLKSDIQLFDFLVDLSAVKAVTLMSAQGDVRRFKLELLGSKSSFLASLKLNNKLTQNLEPQLDDSSGEANFRDKPMKVIVLGETNISTQGPVDRVADKSTSLADVTTVEVIPEVDTKINEQDLAGESVIPTLILAPKTPVFYWELG
ncbi:DUF2066 domain-containing protein [Colwellia piezophila]|uniref:DUF2066 domain-containing protein n=1 Tax=Colwellia piezophila TaxID=211668 RepID=UPI00036055B7|nr:DUF2066 domain-containing protein [Colwellia piezophila]